MNGNAYEIKIECDEDGFHLIVLTDSAMPEHGFNFRIEEPEVFYDHVKAAIGPWLYERDQAKQEYDRMKRAGDTRLLSDEEFSAYVDDAYGDNWSKRVGMEQAREQGYA